MLLVVVETLAASGALKLLSRLGFQGVGADHEGSHTWLYMLHSAVGAVGSMGSIGSYSSASTKNSLKAMGMTVVKYENLTVRDRTYGELYRPESMALSVKSWGQVSECGGSMGHLIPACSGGMGP